MLRRILNPICGKVALQAAHLHTPSRDLRHLVVIRQFARSDALLQSRPPQSLLAACTCANAPATAVMTITESTRRQLFKKTNRLQVIRVDQKRHAAPRPVQASTALALGTWTENEHRLFLEALDLYPSGPWKRVAQHVGTRTPRQVMTHAQKYRQRLQRREANPTPVAVEVARIDSKEAQAETGKVLSVVVSPLPLQISMPTAVATSEIQVEANICVLPARPEPFMDDPPSYEHFTLFDMDLEFLTQLAADPMFDSVDVTLPQADLEPLQL